MDTSREFRIAEARFREEYGRGHTAAQPYGREIPTRRAHHPVELIRAALAP
jgi:hypothetical protein